MLKLGILAAIAGGVVALGGGVAWAARRRRNGAGAEVGPPAPGTTQTTIEIPGVGTLPGVVETAPDGSQKACVDTFFGRTCQAIGPPKPETERTLARANPQSVANAFTKAYDLLARARRLARGAGGCGGGEEGILVYNNPNAKIRDFSVAPSGLLGAMTAASARRTSDRSRDATNAPGDVLIGLGAVEQHLSRGEYTVRCFSSAG